MKTHQPKYLLFLFVLTLLGFTLLVYSQEVQKQLNGEPPPARQSSDTSNSVSANPFQTYVMIFGVLIVLGLAVAVFLGFRKIQQQQTEFEKSERGWPGRLNNIEQSWKGQLERIRRQTKGSIEKLEEEIESNYSRLHNKQEVLENNLSEHENRLDNLELTSDDQPQLEKIIQETRKKIKALVQAYESGEPIDFVAIENPTPSQNVVLILNWIAQRIENWKNDLEQLGNANLDLIQTLGYANEAIKEKLKEIRGPAPPLPTPLELDTNVAYNEFQDSCNTYVSRFEGMLTGLQLARKIDDTEYNQFIPQFIKDRLFNGVARFIPFDDISQQLDEYLQLVGYKVVPIEIGKTQADARLHEIQSSRQANAEPGTVVEVVLPGLQRIDDGEIVQNPVVIRGE